MLSFIRARAQGLAELVHRFADRTAYEEFTVGQWELAVERDGPGFGFFDTRFESTVMGGWEFWGFGVHVIGSSQQQYDEFRALIRMEYVRD